jgi:kinesin family protein C1
LDDQFIKVETSLSAIKAVGSATKSPSPLKFLHKCSNLTGFTGWDVDGRVGNMESQFKELKDMVNSSLTERKSQENALEITKTRGNF